MKAVFFGTPLFSAEILSDLVDKGLDIVAVVTQPDKLQGRNLQLKESAVKSMAQKKCPRSALLQPKKINSPEFIEQMSHLSPDIFVVVAFGQIFPESLIQLPRFGCVNVHTSLLPELRGAAPIERAIMEGKEKTGVSIMYMVKELDAGDVLAIKEVPIKHDDRAINLAIKLCKASKDILYPTLLQIFEGQAKPKPQNHSLATYAKKITQQDALINWSNPASVIFNQYRGVTPKPGAWAMIMLRGKKSRLKILDLEIGSQVGNPGEILSWSKEGILVGAHNSSISIKRLQLEGKKALDASEFIKGFALSEVQFLGSSDI